LATARGQGENRDMRKVGPEREKGRIFESRRGKEKETTKQEK